MGWKSTTDLKREEVIDLIMSRINKITLCKDMSNEELEKILSDLGYGDNYDLPYYGFNFNIID